MQLKRIRGNEIQGHLDIVVAHREAEDAGKTCKWEEVYIHGDPEGLKSFARLLLAIADLNQEKVDDKQLPVGAREHYHLRPGLELANSSSEVIVGRLDAKGTGEFYDGYVEK